MARPPAVSLSLRTAPSATAAPRARLSARLKMADLLKLPEPSVGTMVRDLERDPLFRRLLGMEGGEPVVRRRRFPRASLSGRFREITDDFLEGKTGMDVEGFLDGRRGAAELIRNITAEDFERHFLYQEESLSRDGLSAKFGWTSAQVDEVLDFVLEFSARAEFFRSAAAPANPHEAPPVCLGRIEGDAFDGFTVAYDAPHLARGRYRVDGDAWERRKRAMLPEERSRAASLLGRAEMLNMRADSLHRVLAEALEAGRVWLAAEGRRAPRTLSQREAGRRLGLSSSTVCRVAAGRSVRTPWGQEVRMADLFPQKKRVLRELLTEAADEVQGQTDAQVQAWLWAHHQLKVPRRTVNYWRRKLAAVPGRTER